MNRLYELGFDKLTIATAEQIEQLKQLFQKYFEHHSVSGIMVTHNQNQADQSIEISRSIQQILGDTIQHTFPDFDFFVAHFIVKQAQCHNELQLHQDWNIVDEKKYKSYQIWIPLDVSYPENGGLFFIPRSHLFHPHFRSGSLGKPLIPINKNIFPYLSYFRLFPGEAAIFHNAIFHGSFSNATPENRVAVLINIVEKNAPTEYFHFDSLQHTLQTYPITSTSLLMNLHNLEKGLMPLPEPQKNEIKFHPFSHQSLSIENLIEWIKKDRAQLQLIHDYEFKKQSILKNKEIEKTINDVGYKVINFLTEKEIVALRSEFNNFFPDRKKYNGRYNSMDNLSVEDRVKAHEFIQEIIKNRLIEFFKDFECPISILYSKRNDAVDDTDWHTDPFFIFNPHFDTYYGIWCPLVSIDKDHGVLQVIPYSHRLSNKLINPNFKWQLADKRRLLDKYASVQALEAGQAILYDSRLIHGSAPNISSVERDCIVLRVAPKHADYMCIAPDSTSSEKFFVYKQKSDFFFGNNVNKHHEIPNTGARMGRHYVFEATISEEEIIHFFDQKKAASKKIADCLLE